MAKILIADDDPGMIALLKSIVESLGHETQCESDGLQAGIQAKQWKPDLLISDIQMPNFYGTTAAISLQQSPETARIPILFVSGVPVATVEKMLVGIRQKVKYPNRIRFIPKPIDFALLQQAITELLAMATPQS